VPIAKVEPLTEQDYYTYGCTALLDAIGGAVHHIANVHKYIREEDVPDKTIFVITTDGLENASHEYSKDKVKRLITKMKKEKGWEFLFVAEDLNAVETARNMGISHDRVAFYEAHEDTGTMYEAMCCEIADYRRSNRLSEDWAAKVRQPQKTNSKPNDNSTDDKDNN
jgi:hypothetical protein